MIAMTLRQVADALGVSLPSGMGERKVVRVSTDTRDLQPGDLFFALSGPRFDGHDFVTQALARGAVACVVSRKRFPEGGSTAAGPLLVTDETTAALGRLAAYYRREVIPVHTVVVGVTGSNGKTTTKQMIDHVLGGGLPGKASPKSFNNQIGVPLTVLTADAGDKYLVVEIGTNSPGEIAALGRLAQPDAGVLTSVGEAHLEGLGSLDGVAAEKMSLFEHVRPKGLAVINVDRPEVRRRLPLSPDRKLRCLTVGFGPHAGVRARCLERTARHSVIELDERFRVMLPMPGAHHATNAAAAFLVARWFGLDPETILGRLATFAPPEGRTRVWELAGATIVDDTYNANPASMAAAIETLRLSAAGRRIFVAGDMLELGVDAELHHANLAASLTSAHFDVVVGVGERMRAALREKGMAGRSRDLLECDDAADTARRLAEVVRPGDVVWIKASRAMGLDQAVALLRERLERQAAVA